MKGVLDRFEENNFAVILVEELKQEFIIPKDQLPDGSRTNAWFDVTVDDGRITSIKLDTKKTSDEEKNVNMMMDKLRQKSRGSKFKKK